MKPTKALLIFLLLFQIACSGTVGAPVVEEAPPTAVPEPVSQTFDGQRAYDHIAAQMAFGDARYPGSPGHQQVGDYIISELEESGWLVEEQPLTFNGVEGRNITGKANIGAGPVIILSAHYDTRRVADETPGGREQELPVPGAIDGGSGVGVLLEMADVLDLAEIPREIWLVFFDFEDNGNEGMPGFDWIMGSTAYAEALTITPEALILFDLVGQDQQEFYYEGNSDQALSQELWGLAAELGYGEQFIPQLKYTMIDDHVPFVRRGITAVDIIDFDYPYWHTVEDTLDKADPQNLENVGRVVEVWLEERVE